MSEKRGAMTEYGFRLVDKATRKIERDWQWLSTSEAREHVIRQNTQEGLWLIEKKEREKTTFEMGDLVRILGGDSTEAKIVGSGPGTSFRLQFGNDASTWQQVDGGKLELVAKAKKPEIEPGFVPGRSIM
jgi:hypothetical protein